MYCSILVISPAPQNVFVFTEILLVTKASVIAAREGDKAKKKFYPQRIEIIFLQ